MNKTNTILYRVPQWKAVLGADKSFIKDDVDKNIKIKDIQNLHQCKTKHILF